MKMQRSEELQVFSTIAKIYRALQREFNKRLNALGISYFDFLILKAVSEGPQPMVALSKRYYVTKAAITSAIDRLEEKGLVRRRRGEKDRRTIFVEMTESGEQVYKRSVDLFQDLAREVLKGVDGIEDLNRRLSLILERLNSLS